MAGQTERTSNMVTALIAKSNASDNADVIVWADPATHRLLVNASVSISSGSLTNNNAAPAAASQLGVLPAVANAAAPSWTEGNQVLLSTDLTGALRVTGSLSVGGTTDRATFTAGTSTGTPTMAVFNDVAPATAAEGKIGLVRMSTNRNQYVTLRDAAGNERGANVDANNNLGVVLAAETTKVIGTINLAAAQTLATVTTVSTVTAVTTVSTVTNLAQMNGAALLMGNGATGTGSQRVTIASDNTPFPIKLDQTTPGTTNAIAVAQINAATTLAGNGVTGTGSLRVTTASDNSAVALWGHGATAATVPANAVLRGGRGTTANPTAVTDGQMVAAMADKLGRTVVVVGNVRDMKGNQFTTITSSTSETTVVTAVASTFLDVYGVIVENTSATASKVTFKDSTAGTTQFEIYVPAGDTRGLMLPSSDAFKQTTVNTNWTATCGTSVASIVISVLYVKNI